MTSIVVCCCCRSAGPQSELKTTWDADLNGEVCHECKKLLRNAVALLGMPFSAARPADEDGAGMASMPIAIKGCYKDADAPDNL